MHINCRQFVTKMHLIAPNCVSDVKKFAGIIPPDPNTGEGNTPPRPLPRLGALRLNSRGIRPLDVSTGTSL